MHECQCLGGAGRAQGWPHLLSRAVGAGGVTVSPSLISAVVGRGQHTWPSIPSELQGPSMAPGQVQDCQEWSPLSSHTEGTQLRYLGPQES